MTTAKYNSGTSKEDRQKNKLNQQCSKFSSKAQIKSQCLYCQHWTMFGHVICLKFKNIRYIQRQNRMIKTRKVKVESMENEEKNNGNDNDKNNNNKNNDNNDEDKNQNW